MHVSRLTLLQWVIKGPLIVIVLLAAAGLYAVSGLPRPWVRITGEAHERANYQRFASLAELIRESRRARPAEPLAGQDVVALLRKGGAPTGDLEAMTAEAGLGAVIIRGKHKDMNGMVWAVTKSGHVVKVRLGNE